MPFCPTASKYGSFVLLIIRRFCSKIGSIVMLDTDVVKERPVVVRKVGRVIF